MQAVRHYSQKFPYVANNFYMHSFLTGFIVPGMYFLWQINLKPREQLITSIRVIPLLYQWTQLTWQVGIATQRTNSWMRSLTFLFFQTAPSYLLYYINRNYLTQIKIIKSEYNETINNNVHRSSQQILTVDINT